MTREQLNQFLDAEPSEFTPVASPAPRMGQVEVCVSALELDAWDRGRGLALATGTARRDLGDSVGSVGFSDLHAAAFKPEPVLVEKTQAERRKEFLGQMFATPEYKSLHESTMFNELASELASLQFAEQYVALRKADEKRKENIKRRGKEGDPKAAAKEQQQSELACLRAVSKSLTAAQKEVSDLEDMQTALGIGGDGGSHGKMDVKIIAEAFKRVKDNTILRRICELAGRYRRVAQGKQRQKTAHGYEDLVGIRLDDNISRLLEEELVGLLDPELELDTMRRLSERETLAHDYQGKENVGKGPIVVCVDESGSMSGDPVCQAKAFALAMAWVARHQKRWVALIGYSGGTEGTLCVIPPGQTKEVELLNWLGHFFSGGTDMDVPLVELPFKFWPKIGAPKGKTDLILITDALVNVPKKMEEDFLRWKKTEQVRCITLLVRSEPGDLARVSDEWHDLSAIKGGDGLSTEGVQKCLSI